MFAVSIYRRRRCCQAVAGLANLTLCTFTASWWTIADIVNKNLN